jgi:hypothetical protein
VTPPLCLRITAEKWNTSYNKSKRFANDCYDVDDCDYEFDSDDLYEDDDAEDDDVSV